MNIENKIAAMGLTLPPKAPGKIAHAVRTGNLIYTSGSVSLNHVGKVGSDFTTEQAYDAARDCALGCLAAAKTVIDDLDQVTRVVKMLGLVNCAEGYFDVPSVIHGATDLFVELYGEKGMHARSALGVYQLPLNSAVEVEVIFEVSD